MNNTLLYSKDAHFNEFKPRDHLDVVREFKRLLKRGGRFFIPVPYGRHENHCWQFTKTEKCADCSHFDVHNKSDYEPDYAAVARAVACIEAVK